MKTLNYTAQAGWSRPGEGTRWHYFKAGSRASLCSRVLFTGAPRDDRSDDRANACRDCRDAVRGMRKQLGTIWAKTNHAHDHHVTAVSDWPEHLRVREYPAAVTASSTAESEAH